LRGRMRWTWFCGFIADWGIWRSRGKATGGSACLTLRRRLWFRINRFWLIGRIRLRVRVLVLSNGLLSTSVLLRRECPRRFQGYVSGFYDEYKPETTTEVALVNMMATAHWKLMRMSTPNGKKGFFYETWAYGTADCKRISVPVTESCRISERFIEEERAVMGPVKFEQEYMCSFVDLGDEMFGRDLVERALADEEGWEFP